jgi:shikimate dehydrogenase
VTRDRLAAFIASCDSSWRGLSLTMPLKVEILPLLQDVSELARETGSANTVLFGDNGLLGFNTDVYGLEQGFLRHGRASVRTALVLGGGATAASALVASARLGASRVFVGVRSPDRAASLVDIGRAQGVDVQVRPLEHLVAIDEVLDVVISTLPNGAGVAVELDPDTVQSATLFDVAYSPWPTPLAGAWPGENVIGGLEMLVLQALAQVRIFVAGDPAVPLERDAEVLAAMLAAVGL